MLLMPIGEHIVWRMRELFVRLGERGVDHAKLMRIGADRLNLTAQGQVAEVPANRSPAPSIIACTAQSCQE